MPRKYAKRGRKLRLPQRVKTRRPVEVFLHDTDTVYNAPLDALWEFMVNGGDLHMGAHHATLRNFEGKDLSPNCFEATYESLEAGKWRRFKSRHTSFRPVCKIDEHLEGDFAGSIVLFHYWPLGKRTRVEIWARLRSDVLPVGELTAYWREAWAGAFEEDNSVLPKFLKQRAKG